MKKAIGLKMLSSFIVINLVCLLLSGCGVGGQGSSISGESSPANSTDVQGSDMSGSLPEDGGEEQSDHTGDPAYDPMGRQVLTAVMSYPYWQNFIVEHVREFNADNPTYFVELKCYSENEMDDIDGKLTTQLPLEILSGDGPDLVIWNGFHKHILASEKLMENLYDFMETDPDFRGEDYFENILQGFERNGGLYTLPASFSVSTLCGKREELGADRGFTESWEMGEMLEAYRNSPHAEMFSDFPNREYTLRYTSGCLIKNCVDWESGECHFDSSAFVEYLEFCKSLPVGFENLPESYSESFRRGKIFLHRVILNSPWDMTDARAYFGDAELLWPGWPVPDGEKGASGVSVGIGEVAFSICKNSSNPEGAWEFIKSWLTEEGQREVECNPLLRSVFEERIQDALAVEYEMVDGIEQEKPRYEVIVSEADGSMWFSCITEEEADLYRSLIEGASRGPGSDSGIMDIIEEEAGAYFENDKDAATVADIIQRRVSVYVSERM